MIIRIKLVLSFFLLFLSFLVGAEELPLSSERVTVTYVDQSAVLYDILKIPEEQWVHPEVQMVNESKRDLWIRIPLEALAYEQEYYLTEHKGIRYWELYTTKNSSLVKKQEVDWGMPYQLDALAGQYRGFTYLPVNQYAGDGYVLYIHLRPKYSSSYSFYLRTQENFTKQQQLWSLIQGVGLGYFFIVMLLSLVMMIKLRYRINVLFFLLVTFSSLCVLYISGLGPFLASKLVLTFPHLFWFLCIGMYNVIIILYIMTFLDISKSKRFFHLYFKSILWLSILLVLVIFAIPDNKVFLYTNLQTLFAYVLISLGLIALFLRKIHSSPWLLAGWLSYLLINVLGYVLTALNDGNTMYSVLFFLLGQGLLVMIFGGAMIVEIDYKRRNEETLRKTAENTAHDAVLRMSENERLADMGRLVSSVTHELGTPLGVTVTLSTSLQSSGKRIQKLFEHDQLSQEDFSGFLTDTLESSELIFKNMENARILINGFKEVASDQANPDIRSINLLDYCRMLVKVLLPGIKKSGHRIETDFPEDLSLTCIPGILTQVLTNLINNAVLHGLEGIDDGLIRVRGRQDGDSIILQVEDNGIGIPEDIQEKVFEIYFTTKKGQGGTGVGLNIVRTLVEEHLKGSISLDSTAGQGSCFTIVLPVDIHSL